MLKTKNLFVSFLVLIVFLQFSTASAQNDFQEGYVITNANDTLFGIVRNRKTGAFGEIYKKIRFKGNGKKRRFSAKDIQSYKIGDTEFKSLFLGGEMNFLRVVSEGYVNHYIYEFQEQGEQLVQEVDYLQKGNNSSVVRATQGLFGLKRKRLMNMFQDCSDLVQKIQSKEFKYVFEVVEFYNTWKAHQ